MRIPNLARHSGQIRVSGPKGFPMYQQHYFHGKRMKGGNISTIFKGLYGGIRSFLANLFKKAGPMLKDLSKKGVKQGLDLLQTKVVPALIEKVSDGLSLNKKDKKAITEMVKPSTTTAIDKLDAKSSELLDKILGEGLKVKKKPKKGGKGLVQFGRKRGDGLTQFGKGLQQF